MDLVVIYIAGAILTSVIVAAILNKTESTQQDVSSASVTTGDEPNRVLLLSYVAGAVWPISLIVVAIAGVFAIADKRRKKIRGNLP